MTEDGHRQVPTPFQTSNLCCDVSESRHATPKGVALTLGRFTGVKFTRFLQNRLHDDQVARRPGAAVEPSLRGRDCRLRNRGVIHDRRSCRRWVCDRPLGSVRIILRHQVELARTETNHAISPQTAAADSDTSNTATGPAHSIAMPEMRATGAAATIVKAAAPP